MNEKITIPTYAKICKNVWISDFNITEFRDIQMSPPLTQNSSAATTSLGNDPRMECERISHSVATVMPDSGSMTWEEIELGEMVRKYYKPTKAITWQKHLVGIEPIWMSGQGIIFGSAETEEEYYLQADVTEPSSDLDKETEDMCLKYDLLPYIGEIRSRVYETYHNVISVEPKRTEDPEIEDYEKVCFEIHLSGESAQISQDKRKFYTIFLKEIPKEMQKFFTFTHCIL